MAKLVVIYEVDKVCKNSIRYVARADQRADIKLPQLYITNDALKELNVPLKKPLELKVTFESEAL